MKIIKELSKNEVKKIIPTGLWDALNSGTDDLEYCMICDGLRVKGHKCVSCIITERDKEVTPWE